ncbi:EamA family transporter [Leptospira ellisii]|uniref:EamA family transporter n=1 Tax=Leptospira ellisii TaxID=2023197 RepID=UPI002694A751
MNIVSRFGNEFYLVLCTLIWGGTFTMTIFGLRDTSPSIFLALRFGTASLIFLPFAWTEFKKGKRKRTSSASGERKGKRKRSN